MIDDIKAKISLLRAALQQKGVDFFILSTADEFQNECSPPWARRLQWLTGFSGSNGTVLISAAECLLYTDGRYLTQAANECGDNFSIMDIAELDLSKIANEGRQIVLGCDPMLHTHQEVLKYKQWLQLKLLPQLIDQLWGNKRPTSIGDFYQHDDRSMQRILKLLPKLKDGIDFLLIAMPDQVCWLAGVRGNDLQHSPVALNYGVLAASGQLLMFNSIEKLSKFFDGLPSSCIQVDPAQTAAAIVEHLQQRHHLHFATNPLEELRAIKEPDELEGIRQAHIWDGVALCNFFYWFSQKTGSYTEHQLAEQLLQFRMQSPQFVSESFPTICGFNDNGAIIHYHATASDAKMVVGDGLLLLDSGGQYRCGTTDITRVLPVGVLQPQWIKHYTFVLKSHIDLARTKFHHTATGAQLDGIARAPLWQEGVDYPHGTGHGVGTFLNVHEGPYRIAKNYVRSIPPGVVLSNEPGLYFPGHYGIRLENLMIAQKSEENPQFIHFETISLAPFSKRLIDDSLLSAEQKSWLQQYHHKVFATLSPHLSSAVSQWLRLECAL